VGQRRRRGGLVDALGLNGFAVLGEEVVTPPPVPRMLGGITRELVLELLAGAGRPVRERDLGVAELRRADEVWITSSTREVVPVVRLDGVAVGPGEPGPRWREVTELYRDHKARFTADCAAGTPEP
jgi:D-alanine transaminase